MTKLRANFYANNHDVDIPNTAKPVHDRCLFLAIHDPEGFHAARGRASDKNAGFFKVRF
jgi:hypothetical protein